jgi:hypothetical protein
VEVVALSIAVDIAVVDIENFVAAGVGVVDT